MGCWGHRAPPPLCYHSAPVDVTCVRVCSAASMMPINADVIVVELASYDYYGSSTEVGIGAVSVEKLAAADDL